MTTARSDKQLEYFKYSTGRCMPIPRLRGSDAPDLKAVSSFWKMKGGVVCYDTADFEPGAISSCEFFSLPIGVQGPSSEFKDIRVTNMYNGNVLDPPYEMITESLIVWLSTSARPREVERLFKGSRLSFSLMDKEYVGSPLGFRSVTGSKTPLYQPCIFELIKYIPPLMRFTCRLEFAGTSASVPFSLRASLNGVTDLAVF